jgi:RNA polymerase nonessential primary-like sigma factor
LLETEGLGDGPQGVRSEAIAERLGLAPQAVNALLALAEQPASLDAPLGREAGASLLDSVADGQATDPAGQILDREVAQWLAQGLSELSEREREVLAGRYGLHNREPQTLEALAERIGLTRERVRQIQQEALHKLKHRMALHGVHRDAVL